jgi:hypothetical protein
MSASDPDKEQRRLAELEAAIEKIREVTWKKANSLPELRHAIAVILQDLKL